MDRHHLARLRLRTTLLAGMPAPGSPTQVVDHLVAVQAQEFALARWSVGQRSGADDATVTALLDAAELIRTHVLRPTWHYVRPADLRWLLRLTGPRVQLSLRGYLARAGVDDAVRDRFCLLSQEALAGGRSMTRDELAEVAADAGIVVDRMSLSHLLIHAELEGVLCSGPTAVPASGRAGGRHHTYALLDDRVPAAADVPRTRREAVAELTFRFFAGHGPATVKDLRWWSSLTLTDLRTALADLGDAVEQADVEGRTYWGPVGWTDLAAPVARAHLVQTFDEVVVGYGESRDVLDVPGIAAVVGPDWGRDGHCVVLDGQAVGHWKREGSGAVPVLSIRPRRDLDGPERERVSEAAAELATFLGHTGPIEIAAAGHGGGTWTSSRVHQR